MRGGVQWLPEDKSMQSVRGESKRLEEQTPACLGAWSRKYNNYKTHYVTC